MNFISTTVHRIFDCYAPKNCKFFSLFYDLFQIFNAKIGVHAYNINSYLHEFFEPILID